MPELPNQIKTLTLKIASMETESAASLDAQQQIKEAIIEMNNQLNKCFFFCIYMS